MQDYVDQQEVLDSKRQGRLFPCECGLRRRSTPNSDVGSPSRHEALRKAFSWSWFLFLGHAFGAYLYLPPQELLQKATEGVAVWGSRCQV